MNKHSTFGMFVAAVMFTATVAPAQPVQLTSLSANGQLTVNAPLGSDFSVEWCPALGSNAAWTDRWDPLTFVRSTNSAMKLSVPMFYRVSCYTNGLFWPLRPGSSFVFAVSNALGETALQGVKVLGRCYVPEFTNHYGVFNQDDARVSGGVSAGTVLARSDDKAVWFMYDPPAHLETQEFVRGAVGTVFTNSHYTRIAVEAIENVTVPVGTFTNCIRFHKTQLLGGSSNPNWYEWIAPGLGMVKWVDYNVEPTNAAPVVYVLQSASGI